MGKPLRGKNSRYVVSCLALAGALAATRSTDPGTAAVDLELRPAQQTVLVGDDVDLGLYAVSADGSDESVGFVGAVLVWNATTLALTGHSDEGAFAWAYSGFPYESAGLNISYGDGDAYYQAVVVRGGPLATANAAGALVTTLQFSALSASTGPTAVVIVPCVDTTCTRVLDRHPFDFGPTEITGSLGDPAEVTVLCQLDTHCDDGNPCTDDTCDAGQGCVFTPDDTNDPDDGLFCNGLEICVGGEVAVEPGTIPDCDDGLPCTEDRCDTGTDQCDHVVIEGYCLLNGSCHPNGTVNAANHCEICNSTLDPGQWSLRPAGTACGDQTETDCNLADSCDDFGTCEANVEPSGTPCDDASATVCTAPDTCDGSGTCDPNNAMDGTPCDDDLFCTVTAACMSGVCTGTDTPCPDQVCDEQTDKCKAVNVELRPAKQGPYAIGETVDVDLYVTSGTGTDQAISGLSAILIWEPSELELLGHVDNGPYGWLLSAFPPDSELDGINNTFADGNALYQASSLPSPSPPAVATLQGLLVTTAQFRVLMTGTAQVEFTGTLGAFSTTSVLDAETDGLDITGALGPPASINIVDCFEDFHCDDDEFCTGVETCVDTVCMPGSPPDCDDGAFCNGPEVCEPGVGCISTANPCPEPGSCDEGNNNCGGCSAPNAVAEGARYIAVTPAAGAEPVAILIQGDPGDTTVSCLSMYVQADGTLGTTVVRQTAAAWGTVHLAAPELVPATRYDVYADCRQDGSGSLSAPVSTTTWLWGDADNDGAVQINDIGLVFQGSQGNFPEGTTVENLDMAPCVPDRTVDADDVAAVQQAFAGTPFPCSAPCDVCVLVEPPEPDPMELTRNRYLAVQAGNAGRATAIRVTFASLPEPFHIWNGMTFFAGGPFQVCENAGQGPSTLPPDCGPAPGIPQGWFWAAVLECDPEAAHFMDWTDLTKRCVGGDNDGEACIDDFDCPGEEGSCGSEGTIHLYHEGIVPSRLASSTGPIEEPALYDIQLIDERCALEREESYTPPLQIMGGGWGDVVLNCSTCPCGAPDDAISVVTDLVSILAKFSNDYCAPRKTRTDLRPNDLDFKIDISDVVQCLAAFVGSDYPYGAGNCIQELCSGGADDGALCFDDSDCSNDPCPTGPLMRGPTAR